MLHQSMEKTLSRCVFERSVRISENNPEIIRIVVKITSVANEYVPHTMQIFANTCLRMSSLP